MASSTFTTTSDLHFPASLRGKRVLLATESFGPVNGVSRTTLNLVRYLRANGVQVAVVAPRISGQETPEDLKDTNTPSSVLIKSNSSLSSSSSSRSVSEPSKDIEIRLNGYPLPYNPSLSVVYPFRLSKIYDKTFQGPPDLIYLASPASLGFQVLYQLRQDFDSKVPVLLNFQTDLSGYCEILFPGPLAAWAVMVFGAVQGYLFRHDSVKTVFYPSVFVRRYLEGINIPQTKIERLTRGVDSNLFHPSRRSHEMHESLAPNKELLLICVARLAPEKGFEFLADAARELDARGFPFKLLIVGGNQNSLVESAIHGLFSDLQEAGKVSFAGLLKGEALATAYASADIFLHCSITETFGLVVLESMASGVPVIARDEGGPSDIVQHGQSGYLIPPSDLNGFVEKIVLLGSDKLLRVRMSIQGRQQASVASWEGIGNQAAWKMVEALDTRPNIVEPPPAKWYSWYYPVQQAKKGIESTSLDARRVVSLGVICGVWVGLLITWILAESAPYLMMAVNAVPGARKLLRKIISFGKYLLSGAAKKTWLY